MRDVHSGTHRHLSGYFCANLPVLQNTRLSIRAHYLHQSNCDYLQETFMLKTVDTPSQIPAENSLRFQLLPHPVAPCYVYIILPPLSMVSEGD